MKLFSEPRFNVDVLKVEVPVNMKYVEGFAEGEVVYTKEEAAQHFKDQDAATHLPYIYLSAGVSAELFQETLKFAHEAGAKFNGVLCGVLHGLVLFKYTLNKVKMLLVNGYVQLVSKILMT